MLRLGNGIACGIATLYTLLFLPVLPLALVGMLIYGLGFLPLTPVLALLAALIGRWALRRMAATMLIPAIPALGWGCGLALLLLISAEVPITFTRLGMQMATAEAPETRQQGLRWLRTVGSADLLLRACYQRPGRATDILGALLAFGHPVHPDAARTLYYQVTGMPFNAVPPPTDLRQSRAAFWGGEIFDIDRGAPMVGGRVPGLSMASSRLDGSVDADAALAYLEWTLIFKNDASVPREARAQIALPAGGVVSRLTLWIDGEPREAAFGTRSAVRQAYERVVRRQRDPVLVTTSGPDRILVQAFPVPGAGHTSRGPR